MKISRSKIRLSYGKVVLYMYIYIYSACNRCVLAPENTHTHTNYSLKKLQNSWHWFYLLQELCIMLWYKSLCFDEIVYDS